MSGAPVRGALAVVGLSGLAIAIACSSGIGGSGASGACSGGIHGFSQSRVQIADLADLECDVPVAAQSHGTSNAQRIIDALKSQPHSGLRPEPETTQPLTWSFPSPYPAGIVTSTPAVYLASPAGTSNDTLFFGSQSTTGPNFFALRNLYAGQGNQTVAWTATLGGQGMEGSWVEFDASYNVYAVDTTGTLWCFTEAGAGCAGWNANSTYPSNGSSKGAQYTSPWWSSDQAAIYFADSTGTLYKVSAANGSLVWSLNLNTITPTNSSGTATSCPGNCNTFPVRSSPVEYNGHIYIGNDGGAYFNITDPGTSASVPTSNVQANWLCGTPVGTGGCNGTSETIWSVINASSIDVSKSLLYTAVAGTMFEFPLAPSSWQPDNRLAFAGSPTYAVQSSPILDRTDGLIYVGFNNSLYKITYPLAAGSFSSVALQGSGANASYPHGSPLPYAGNIYVGDGAGELEQYACMGEANPQAPLLTGVTSAYGSSIDSTPISNYAESAVNVGYSNGSGAGGAAQIAYTGAFSCPGGASCTSAPSVCGGAVVCTHGGGCCTAANCPTAPSGGSYACTNGSCVLSCGSGETLCTATNECIPSGWCCTNANCTSPQTCSPTTGQCIAPIDTVTLNLNYPVNATMTSITGTVVSPTTTLTTGTLTVTNGSTTVTGSGTTFTTSYTTSMGGVSVTNGGVGCTSAPTITLSGGGGSGATATAIVTSGSVSAISVTGGSGYTSAPSVAFSVGGCTTMPVATASIGGEGTAAQGTVTAVTLTQSGPGGAGYTSVPSVGFSGSVCTTNPAATASLSGQMAIAITSGGAGYTGAPTVSFTGGCTTEPFANATISGGAVTAITVTTPGSGCASAPTVVLTGGGFTTGHAATAKASTSVASVTLTNGGSGCTSSPTVTLNGGSFTTQATASAETALSFSIDGSTWYEVASVASATSLTLRSPYLGVTEAGLATYYETDCNAATQSCNQTYPFTISNLAGVPTCTGSATCPTVAPTCNTVTCGTSVNIGLSAGAFGFSVVGYDSSNRKEASAILNDGLDVTAPTTTTAYLNMIRSYPIGTGNATCPLNMAEDSSGNIWTVNGNGNSGSSCPSPTNNLSELVKSASPPYAPTVIDSSSITSSPEWIAADNAGNVWVTVPGVENGIFGFNASHMTTPFAQYSGGTNCIVPRGIDIDPNSTPNGVFVACAGNSSAGEGYRDIIRMSSIGHETSYFDFNNNTDTAQPVSLVYARAYTPGSGLLLNTDYHGNYEVYVNRSSATEVVISALEWDPVTQAFFDPCSNSNSPSGDNYSPYNTYTLASGLNPFGLSYDSGGTPYAVARAGSGEVINVELDTGITQPSQVTCSASTMNQDSLDAIAGPAPWGTANDDVFTYPGSINSNTMLLAGTTFYTSHNTTARVTRFADGEKGPLDDYIVGATSNPGPQGLLFDRSQGVVWVADSLEASLTQINKNLMLFANETNVGTWSAVGSTGTCPGLTSKAAGSSVSIVGYGFDTSLSNGSNNTVLLAGYMATTTAVTTGNSDGVGNLVVSNGGSGYTSAPTVTLSGGGCTTEPTATALISGPVTVTLQSGGANYTSAPTVAFSAAGGTAATGVATVSGGVLTGVTFTQGGAGYTSAPMVTFAGAGCSPEPTATATISPTTTTAAVTFGGSNYTAPTVTFTGGCTTEPVATANVTTGVTSVAITAGGGSYTAPTVAFTGGGCSPEPTGTVTISAGVITGVTLTGEGNACTSAPTPNFTDATGSGATATATTSTGVIGTITVTADANGCTSPPTVSITDSTGSGATATATLTGGTVTALDLETDGSGCSGAPLVTLTGGGASVQATVTATESGGTVTGIALSNGGLGFTSQPTVTFSGGGGTTQATATTNVSQSFSFDVTAGGSYTGTVTVALSGGGCSTEPTATPVLSGGVVQAITLVTPGVGCTFSPTVAFTGTHTAAAAAKAITSVTSITLTAAGGAGYSTSNYPTVEFIGGCAIEPLVSSTAPVTISGGEITAVNVVSQGVGCSGPPEVTIANGSPTKQAAASATISGSVTGGGSGTFNVNDSCSGTPTVSFSSGSAVATLQWVDPLPTTLTVTVPTAPHGITGPVTVSNQGGQVVSYCTFTTE
jgi:hypothetical protein